LAVKAVAAPFPRYCESIFTILSSSAPSFRMSRSLSMMSTDIAEGQARSVRPALTSVATNSPGSAIMASPDTSGLAAQAVAGERAVQREVMTRPFGACGASQPTMAFTAEGEAGEPRSGEWL
jgi:hypothetical protein